MWGCEKQSDLYLHFTLNLTSYPPKSSLFLAAVLSHHLRNTSMDRVWITHKDRKECIKVMFVWNSQIEGTDHGAGTWDKLFSGSQGQERERRKNWRPKDQIPAFSMISRTRLFCSCLAPSQRLPRVLALVARRIFPRYELSCRNLERSLFLFLTFRKASQLGVLGEMERMVDSQTGTVA